MQGVAIRILRVLPRSLAQRLPLLVIVSYVFGAVIAGWTIHNLSKRSSALSEAENSGELLADVIQTGAQTAVNNGAARAVGPYLVAFSDALPTPLTEHSIPLILDLDGQRLRAAIALKQPARLPNTLRADPKSTSAAERMADLSRGIARQDQAATLYVFLPQGEVLAVTAPRLWQARLSQTVVALVGVVAFAVGLSLTVPLSRNLAIPFARLAARGTPSATKDVLPSTEAILIRDKLRRQEERFRIDQERRSRSLAAVSHDLRTPVTRLRLRAELLEDDKIRDRFEADLDEVSGIIDGALDLLSLSEQPEESYDFSLVSLLESLVNDYRDVGKDVSFDGSGAVELKSAASIFATSGDLTVVAGEACLMRGQPDKLRRAFSNLIDNALTYGGRAIVSVSPDKKNMLRVRIRDFGPGIDSRHMDRVLLPFVRGHASKSSTGVGLGLSIAQELIELHRGSLELANCEPGLQVTALVHRGF